MLGYLSHPIRGAAGNNATKEEMEANYTKARAIGTAISDEFPELSLYIPADMDLFLAKRNREPIPIVRELLDLDKALVRQSDILLVYSPDLEISSGMKEEIDIADKYGVYRMTFTSLSNVVLSRIRHALNEISKG